MGTECRHGQRHGKAHLNVTVAVLADQDDRHRIECDPHEEGAPNGASLGTGRDERQVERDDERRLDRDEIEAK